MGKRKYICCLVLFLCSLLFFLAACGGREKENAGQSGPAGPSSVPKDNAGQKEKGDAEVYYDIATTTEEFFDVQSLDWGQVMGIEREVLATMPLGMQFYQEEPVQLWGVLESKPITMKVYLCMGDGSVILLFSGLPQDYGGSNRSWFLDQEGNAYLFGLGKVMKFDVDGKVLYDRELDITDTTKPKTICQLPDGSIYMLVSENGRYKLATLDPVSGSVSIVDELGWSSSPQAVGVAEDGLLYMDVYGFWKLDPKDKTQRAFLLFGGTTYYEDSDKVTVQAIRAEDDGSVQILRTGQTVRKENQPLSQGRGKVETLKKANVADERIPIVIGGRYFNSSWIKAQVVRFNQSQTDYYVVFDEHEGDDIDDYVRQIGVEIATGKGPDILYGKLFMEDSIYSMVQKGIFEDLKPYMDKSGIREEDYFPLAFSSWRDGEEIYSINPCFYLEGYRIEEGVLGSRKEPDIGTLMDALLAYGEDAFYLYNHDSQDLLRMFLEGSEDLWGMVDWEKGTCDFGGELFAKILQVSGRYGYDERFRYPAVAEQRNCDYIVGFDSSMEQEKEKMVTSGVLFDDGCHAGVTTYSIWAINANSAHKEGAWEFLKLLLGEEAQSELDSFDLPALKHTFDERMAEQLTHVDDKYAGSASYSPMTLVNGEWIMGVSGATRTLKDLTEEKVAEFRATVEDARPYPIRTGSILDIIQEEAAYYFDGTKDIDGVRRIIENRVRLYLEENG